MDWNIYIRNLKKFYSRWIPIIFYFWFFVCRAFLKSFLFYNLIQFTVYLLYSQFNHPEFPQNTRNLKRNCINRSFRWNQWNSFPKEKKFNLLVQRNLARMNQESNSDRDRHFHFSTVFNPLITFWESSLKFHISKLMDYGDTWNGRKTQTKQRAL